jgi:hemerythrin
VPFLAWSSELELGIPSIDAEHRRIVSLLDVLHAALLERGARETIAATLDELASFAALHWAHEEKLFAEVGFTEAPAHTEEHRLLAARVAELRTAVQKGEPGVPLEVLDFIRTWLAHHILDVDSRFAELFRQHGVV